VALAELAVLEELADLAELLAGWAAGRPVPEHPRDGKHTDQGYPQRGPSTDHSQIDPPNSSLRLDWRASQ